MLLDFYQKPDFVKSQFFFPPLEAFVVKKKWGRGVEEKCIHNVQEYIEQYLRIVVLLLMSTC